MADSIPVYNTYSTGSKLFWNRLLCPTLLIPTNPLLAGVNKGDNLKRRAFCHHVFPLISCRLCYCPHLPNETPKKRGLRIYLHWKWIWCPLKYFKVQAGSPLEIGPGINLSLSPFAWLARILFFRCCILHHSQRQIFFWEQYKDFVKVFFLISNTSQVWVQLPVKAVLITSLTYKLSFVVNRRL